MAEGEKNIQRIDAKVLGYLRPGYLEVILGYGIGLLDGGIPTEIPIDIVPPDMRLPNTLFSIIYDKGEQRFLSVERRESPDQ